MTTYAKLKLNWGDYTDEDGGRFRLIAMTPDGRTNAPTVVAEDIEAAAEGFGLTLDPLPPRERGPSTRPERPEPPVRIPRSVANWRAKTITDMMGITADIDALVDAVPAPEGIAIRRAWYGNGEVARAMVDQFAEALELTPEAIDQMFLQASQLLT
jgi:hypothetical protein